MAGERDRSTPVLLGDVGGTNARLALYMDGRLAPISHFSVAENPDPIALIARFLEQQSAARRPARAVLAAAGPVAPDGRRVNVTNSPWALDAARLEADLGIGRVLLVNDFAAIAWALTRLGRQDLLQIGPGEARAGAPCTILGPGTGLGVAHLLTVAGRPVVLATEGGHATMAAADAEEARILDQVREHCGHVSAERVLSGAGLVNLHEAVVVLAGRQPHAQTPEMITGHAAEGCGDCDRSVELFLAMLGSFAGNLALTLDARGGVYIAGGIVPRLVGRLETSRFRERFESKGRFVELLRRIPTRMIRREDVAFEGLIAVSEQ